MKYLSRLTALLLALVLLFSSSVGSIAEANLSDLTRSSYDQMVLAAQEAAEAEAAAAALEAAKQPIINEGGVVYAQDIPEQTKRFDIYEVISDKQLAMGGETEITLPQSGKINLSAGTAAQWQIYIPGADMWVNIAGETGDTFALTYAVIGGMLSGGSAKVRALAGDSAAVANVSVAYGSALPPVEEEETFAAEPMVASTFSLRRSAATVSEDANAGIMTLAEGDGSTMYGIVVNYSFTNGDTAASSYSAILGAGANHKDTIITPVVKGYIATADVVPEGFTFSTSEITIDVQNIQQNYVLNVVYQPTNVNYTVQHFIQNVDDDNYMLHETKTETGLTNTVVPDVHKTMEGFRHLNYEKPYIAADGSTVIQVYYDRNYYLMNFNLGGGYGVDSLYARYGAEIGVGKDVEPKLAGYTFVRWLDEEGEPVESIPATMPAYDTTFVADWKEATEAKVTVLYWGENANDTDYTYYQSAEVFRQVGTSVSYVDNEPKCGYIQDHEHIEACYDCGNEGGHQHNTGCYDGIWGTADAPSNVSNPQNGDAYRALNLLICSFYRVYIGGDWYWYFMWGSDGSSTKLNPNCNMEVDHKHTNECLACDIPVHVHNENCYPFKKGMDTRLWTYNAEKSETVTVLPDGSTILNVYFDRTEFTLTFKNNRDSDSTFTETITDKWGARILDEFEAICNRRGNLWSLALNGNYPWISYIEIMPQENITYYAGNSSGDDQTATYYIQKLGTTNADNAANYEVYLTVPIPADSRVELYVSKSSFIEIEGFTVNYGLGAGKEFSAGKDVAYSGAKFYYMRNTHELKYNNGFDNVKSEIVQYQAPLAGYDAYVPALPSAYEPGSRSFTGWYVDPQATEKFDFTQTMPDSEVMIYAGWQLVDHKINFYQDKTALDNGTKLDGYEELIVTHGDMVPTDKLPADPISDEGLNFLGWFYTENGKEYAFNFETMSVRKDMDVYAKWNSDKIVEYTVYFKYRNNDTGVEVDIADPITGTGLVGSTKTFDAKGGEELYTGYQEGYFPGVKSHSMTLSGKEEATNSFTFYYAPVEAVPYTVKYLRADTLEQLADPVVHADNRSVVVTETFKVIPGYMPDAYQKKLVVSTGVDAVNEIVFYYTVDTENAYYRISHWTQMLNGSWVEYGEGTQASNKIGTMISVADRDLTIPGFTYDSAKTELIVGDNTQTGVTSANLTQQGLEFKLYYTRNMYPYEVRYVEMTTGQELADTDKLTGKYNELVNAVAKDIDGYEVYGESSRSMTISIEDLDEGASPVINVITFYYRELSATINYEIFGPEGSGSLSDTSETLPVLTGSIKGSIATPASDAYLFAGWYTDAACENPVTAEDGITYNYGTWFLPAKQAKDANGNAITPQYIDVTYYAKFVENTVTISYEAVGPDGETDFGSVSKDSETVGMLTGTPTATATANPPKFKFVGWYDAEDNLLSTEATYVPQKTDHDGNAETAPVFTEATYYAKFDWDVGKLTITKTGMENAESAIVKVTVTTDTEKTWYVVLNENNPTVTLSNLQANASYEVEEVDSWTTLYSVKGYTNQKGTIPGGGEVTATIVNTRADKWLNDESYKKNVFNAK